MTRSFDRLGLLSALDAIGAAAVANGTRVELAIYGGSALMLAGNFRFATEDVDIAEISGRRCAAPSIRQCSRCADRSAVTSSVGPRSTRGARRA